MITLSFTILIDAYRVIIENPSNPKRQLPTSLGKAQGPRNIRAKRAVLASPREIEGKRNKRDKNRGRKQEVCTATSIER